MSKAVGTKQEAVQRLQAARQELRRLGVSKLGLFGSFVTGRQTADSDVDVFVEFTPGQHSFDNFMELSFFLEDVLGRKVEVVTPEALSPHIGPHILREVELVPLAA